VAEGFSVYLAGYPQELVDRVQGLHGQSRLLPWLQEQYPEAHQVRTDRALYDYVQDMRARYLRNGAPVDKVLYDSRLRVLQQALGTHTRVARVQGSKLKTRREIRIGTQFRQMPEAFLRMIVVHELAHLKEMNHDKAFYQLCQHMEPDYPQLEFHARIYLGHLDQGGEPLWSTGAG